MVETTFFTDRIDLLCNVTLSELAKDFIFQIDLVDSSNFNHTFNSIENHLTSLYEKTRAMQDVVAYLEEYIKMNVLEYTTTCETILSQIETDRDKLKQKSYMTIPVIFSANTKNKKDRNGKILSECSVKNNKIFNHLSTMQVFNFSNTNKVKGFKSYNENLKELLNNKPYRTFYILDAPIINGLSEQIKLSFDQPKPINMITIDPVKCEVTDIEYIYQNTIEHEDGFYNLFKRTRYMDAIQVTLKSTAYKEKIYLVDNLRKTANCWEKIAENEYASLYNTSALSQAELDNLLGLTQFRIDYNNYLKEIELWKQKRQTIAELNRRNGYDDKVPEIDILVAPSEIGLNTPIVSVSEDNEEKKIQYTNTAISTSTLRVNKESTNTIVEDGSEISSATKLSNVLPSTENYRYQSISETLSKTNYGFMKNVASDFYKNNSTEPVVSDIKETSNYAYINKYRE